MGPIMLPNGFRHFARIKEGLLDDIVAAELVDRIHLFLKRLGEHRV